MARTVELTPCGSGLNVSVALPAAGEEGVMSGAKAIPIILARQLASCVAMPILLVDVEGNLIFYNEAAEALMGQRFEETGEIPAEEWNRLVTVADENHVPLADDERPLRAALLQRRPVSRRIWTRRGDRAWRQVQVTAFPLVGAEDRLLGAMNIFWEVR
jgi:PAS domain-containing protein